MVKMPGLPSSKKEEYREEYITKTCLYNFDPLKSHFYIVKLGFTEVYIIFLISAEKYILWILVRTAPPRQYPLCFEQKYEKYQKILSENFHFLVVKFSVYLNRCAFVMFFLIFAQKKRMLLVFTTCASARRF